MLFSKSRNYFWLQKRITYCNFSQTVKAFIFRYLASVKLKSEPHNTNYNSWEFAGIFCHCCPNVGMWVSVLHLISRLIHNRTNRACTGLLTPQHWLMNPQHSTTIVLHACLWVYNHFSVTLIKNHYTFMHIRHHTCPIHLLANRYLFLSPMPLPGLVSN